MAYRGKARWNLFWPFWLPFGHSNAYKGAAGGPSRAMGPT